MLSQAKQFNMGLGRVFRDMDWQRALLGCGGVRFAVPAHFVVFRSYLERKYL